MHWFTNLFILFFSSVARIQFKLPNGVSQIHRFDPENTIDDLYNYVINELTTPYGTNVSLSTTFPSRNLDDVERLVSKLYIPSTLNIACPYIVAHTINCAVKC